MSVKAGVRLLLAFGTSLLAACASLPIGELGAGAFELNARVAVRYGEESATGRVAWRHSATTDDVIISNPLGQGIAEISRRDNVYRLLSANGDKFEATDPEQLTEQALGWRLPINGLSEWIQGRTLPGIPAQARYEDDRLIMLEQSGWQIDYLEYNQQNGLPVRMRLSREGLDIRLAIEEWQLGH